jgi:membrane fusion protein (multidrug efflux system)
MKKGHERDIKDNWMGRHRRLFMIGVPLILLAAGLVYYALGGRYVSTEDAYVQAARVAVSTDISGRVSRIPVADNQLVHKGEVLLTLDKRSLEIAERAAEARLADTRLQVAAMKATYGQKLADLKSAEHTLVYERQEYARQKKLARSGIASQAQLDKALQMLQTAQQNVNAKQQGADSALAALGGKAHIRIDAHPAVRAALARLDRARLDLSYTTVRAPMDGYVTKVERVRVGDYVKKAEPLFALVSNTDIWVEANFKETTIAHMRPGQRASVEVDAFSGRRFSGRVASLSPGTGASFSLLPPENATGNWVKVVQRVPVRIVLDKLAADPLRAGLSATAWVDTGHRRLSLGD